MRSVAFLARMTRGAMLDVLSSDFVRTARAKGLSELAVVGRHAFRNALIPVITVLGLDVGNYLTGSLLTETIFAGPGVGRYVLAAIERRDLPAIQGSILFMSVVFVLVNLLTDLLYAKADPRIADHELRAGRAKPRPRPPAHASAQRVAGAAPHDAARPAAVRPCELGPPRSGRRRAHPLPAQRRPLRRAGEQYETGRHRRRRGAAPGRLSRAHQPVRERAGAGRRAQRRPGALRPRGPDVVAALFRRRYARGGRVRFHVHRHGQ